MIALLALTMSLTPWTGANLPTATADAARYRLTISGKPGSVAHLRTRNVAEGWIAAFCNNRVCSPSQVTQAIPQSGRVVLQFELIRETETSPHKSGAIIESDNGSRIVVAPITR